MRYVRLFLLALLPAFAAAQTVQFKSSNVAISGGTVQGITTLGARSSGAAFDLQIGSSEALTASRLLKFNVADAARTITVPGTTVLPIVSQTLTISGPTAARTITVPDSAFTVARTDAGQTFTGDSSVNGVWRVNGPTNKATVKIYGLTAATDGAWSVNSQATRTLALTDDFQGLDRVTIDANGRLNALYGAAVTGSVSATTTIGFTNIIASATAPSVTGFGSSPSVPNNNGTSAFTVNVGTGGTANTGSVTLPAAATGWVCTAQDVTTPASFVTAQTGGTTTTATFANYSRTTGLITAWTASDVLRVSCFAY